MNFILSQSTKELLLHLQTPSSLIRIDVNRAEIYDANPKFLELFNRGNILVENYDYRIISSEVFGTLPGLIDKICISMQSAIQTNQSQVIIIANDTDGAELTKRFCDPFIEIRNTPIKDFESGLTIILQSINGKQKIEHSVDNEEISTKLSMLMNIIEEPFILLDRNLKIYDLNRRSRILHERYFGEILKKHESILNYIDKKFVGIFKKKCQQVLSGKTLTSELILKGKTDVKRTFSLKYKPVKNSLKEVIGISIIANLIVVPETNVIRSEKRLRSLVQDGSDLIAILSSEGIYQYVSPTSKSILNINPSEFIGLNAFDFIHPEDREFAFAEFSRIGLEHRIELQPFRFRHKDGNWRWVETIITDLRKDPSIMGIVSNSRDVTEKIAIQLALEKSHERYGYVSQATSDAIWDCDLRTQEVFWGEGFRTMFGYPNVMQLVEMTTWTQMIHPEDSDRIALSLNECIWGSNDKWSDEYRWRKSNGQYAYVIDKGFIIRDDSGKAVRMVGAMRDITERKEEDLRLKLLESFVNQTNDAVTITESEIIDIGGPKIIYVNQAFSKMTGYTTQEVLGNSPGFLHGKKTSKEELKKLNKAVQNYEAVEITVINYRKNGEEFWMNFSATPIANEKGTYTHWIAIHRDVTETKIAESQKALISEINEIFNRGSKLSTILKHTLAKIAEVGNRCLAEIWLLDPEQKKLRLIAKSINPGDIHKFFHARWNVTTLGLGVGLPGRVGETGNSETWTVDYGKPLIRDESVRSAGIKKLLGIPLIHNKEITGVMVLGFSEVEAIGYLTEDYKLLGNYLGSEIKRHQLEKELDQIFSFAPDILSITSFDGHFKKVNPAGCKLLGYTSKALLHKPITDFLHPEDRYAVSKWLPYIGKKQDTFSFENRCVTKSGKIRWIAWTANVVLEEGLIYSVGRDVTEKKNLEDLLNKSNTLANIGSWEIDVIHKSVYWSDITKKIRQTPVDIVPDLIMEIKYYKAGKNRNTYKKRIQECMAYGKSWDEELEIITFTGKTIWIRTIGQAELVFGKCTRIFGSFQDIDKRKRAEIDADKALIALEESEKRYSELFHLSPLPMWIYAIDSLKILEVNKAATEHYGFSAEEFANFTIRDIRPHSELPKLEESLAQNANKIESQIQDVFIHQKKDGTLINVEIKSRTIMFKGKMSKVIIVYDITERLNYYNAIAEQNDKLRDIAHIQSHVIRAPLSRLMGLIYILKNKLSQKEMTDEQIIKAIENAAKELDTLIRKIVDKTIP